MQNNFIHDVRNKANGHWQTILERLAIPVNRSEGPCPACGGKTRYRFDDMDGRGTYFCSHCGAGTGLDLVMKVSQCSAYDAAEKVAEVMALPVPEPQPAREKPQINISGKVAALLAKSVSGQSAYLTAKGIQFPMSLLSDGSLLVTLANGNGEITGAQVIKPDGSKRLVAGTVKKGSFFTVNTSDNPKTVIIGEGLATVLSVHLMRPDAMAVVAIDAGNLLPVALVIRQKYPEAQIIIAADNDIRPEEPNTGLDAAVKAAKPVSGWLTLPPTEYKADWNDYHQTDGLEAATTAFNDSMYQPEGKKVTVKLKAIEGGKNSSRQSSDNELKPRVESRKEGIFWVTPKEKGGEVTETESWLCSPLEVISIGTDGRDRYLILRWQPEGEKVPVIRAVPLADIGEREGWRTLKAGGVNVTTKSNLRAILADWLQRNGHGQLWRVAHATGWQCGAYIMPDGSVIGEPKNPVMFNDRSATAGGYNVRGTVKSWRENVAGLARGNPSMMLGIACSFAAPLIGLTGAEGFGVHLFGGSSAGKTTTANAASSVWGEPEALKLTWYSTALGLVNEAAAHNDGFMPLDEIGQGSNRRAVAESAYALFNGVGKIQGAKEGGNRDLKRWRAMVFSTGEIDLESYIRADGGKVNAGQLVRLLNVPVSRATVFHGLQDGKSHADAMKAACQIHHGAAGRAWVSWLCEHRDDAAVSVREAEHRWSGLLPASASEQVRRVASRFAILEAALLLSAELTGWDVVDIRDALQHSFNAWVNEFGMGNREAKAWVEQAEAFLQRYGFSRYLPYPDSDPRDLPIKDLAGYRVTSQLNDMVTFHTWPSVFRDEIAAGANYVAFAQVLADAGMLDKPKKGITKKTLKHNGKQRHFVVMTMAEDAEE
ncbi:DUF927 domain-containing protein [Salmonella enterica]|nr:DUF927 domain-containing protein [Salmonella enterica]